MRLRPVHHMASLACVPCDFVQCIGKSDLDRIRKLCQFCGILHSYGWIDDKSRTRFRLTLMGTCPHGRKVYTEPVYMCQVCRTAKAHETAEGRVYKIEYPEIDPFYILERENDHQPR